MLLATVADEIANLLCVEDEIANLICILFILTADVIAMSLSGRC